MFSLEGHDVVVIGAGSGIGAAVATACAGLGARVVLAGRSAEKLERVRAGIGGPARVETVDVADEGSVRGLIERVGPFDHLLLSAKPAAPAATLAEVTEATIGPLVGTKLLGAVYTLKHSAGALREGGSVTLVSGLLGWRPGPNAAILAAVNGALASLARAAAIEFAPRRVNVIVPGVIDTPTWAGIPEARRAEFFAGVAAKLPVGRVGRPEDVAQAAVYLMSNGFVTGTTLYVDGGALIV